MNARLAVISWHWARIGLALLVCVWSGCGKADRAKVTGKLTRQDGAPLVGANVIAHANDTGKNASAYTDKEGNFELGTAEESDGVPPGDYNVVIVEDRGESDHRRKASIAAKYRDPAKSGVAFSLKAGESKDLSLTLDAP